MDSKPHLRSPTLSSRCSSHSPVPEPEPEKTSPHICSPVLPSSRSFLVCSGAISAFSLPCSHSRPSHWPSVHIWRIGGTPKAVAVGMGHHLILPSCSCASTLGIPRYSLTVLFSNVRTASSILKACERRLSSLLG